MTRQEAIGHLDYMRKAYQKLIDEKVDSGKFVGTDIQGEWKADTSLDDAYKVMIVSLNMAIETMKSYDGVRQKEYNEGFNACFDSLIPNQEKMYERGKADVLKVVEDIRAEIRQKIANPPEGNDYECGRVDAFNEVLNLIDEHIKGVSDAQEL